jgi:PIN domain nuclease of toxin-antitoxin system
VTGALLDTNAFLQLGFMSASAAAQSRSTLAGKRLFVSQVCAIEIAIKHSIGKLELPPSYTPSFEHGFNETATQLAATVLPIELSHVAALSRLPFHHRDPFDRIMICQALVEDMALVTRDGKFALYAGLDLIRL